MKTIKILLLGIFLSWSLFNTETYGDTLSVKRAGYWYTGMFLGTQLSANGNTTIPSINSKPPLTSEPVYNTGYIINLNAGYKFHKLSRIEAELAYRNLPMEKIKNAIGEGTETNVENSNTELFSFFVNGYYDLSINQRWMVYFGAGVGYVQVKNTIHPSPPIQVSESTFFTLKELDYNTSGYQGITGIAYKLTRNINLHFAYKYFSTFEATKTARTNLGPDSYETKQKVITNTISFGVSFSGIHF
jgi:opacity protein-like surface antigen